MSICRQFVHSYTQIYRLLLNLVDTQNSDDAVSIPMLKMTLNLKFEWECEFASFTLRCMESRLGQPEPILFQIIDIVAVP